MSLLHNFVCFTAVTAVQKHTLHHNIQKAAYVLQNSMSHLYCVTGLLIWFLC